jgi:diaminohydroxyphosphoribosylaminopyrimidine deaminase / 5-amino-6-(5-phosphoribosylamino)uracil reductase
MSHRDEQMMRRALALAERGRASTAPNPMVGCVVAHGDEVVGEGWHERAGEPHAEVHALRAAGARARGATAYVTLEPCAHTGRTPPCVDALLTAGVARVVIAAGDPDPRVAGRGVARLREAGVEVTLGVLEADADAQNVAYRTQRSLGRPWVRYKTAMTLDGKIATRTGRSRWITGDASRALVQRWRSEHDLVAVGVTTVLRDDPRLTARVDGGRTPHKLVFDSVARTPGAAALFAPDDAGVAARVTIAVGPRATEARVAALRDRGATVLVSDDGRGRPSVSETLAHLAQAGALSLLLEGGGTVAWSFAEARALDRVAWFVAPKLLGGTAASPLGGLGVATMEDALTLAGTTVRHVGDDLLIEGDVVYPSPGDVVYASPGDVVYPSPGDGED